MSALIILALDAANSGGMHILLLLLWIVAIALILFGAAFALFTLYSLRKTRTPDADHPSEK